MKHALIFSLSCIAYLIISNTAFSQSTTPTDPNVINHSHIGNGLNQFEVVPLTPSTAGAFYSHLWWSGDNSFTFVDVPQHTHARTKGNQLTFPQVKMTDITTENYGTGGPPPLTYTFTTNIGNTSPRQVLPQGTDIYVQHYRNAVINDVMYLIVTYGNSTDDPLAGRLRLDLGSYARVDNVILNAHPHFFPNLEMWDPNTNECEFKDLQPTEERSILIPVKILANEEDELPMRVDLFRGEAQEHQNQPGIDFFAIAPAVAHSHDPNIMLESSDAHNQCDYRNGTIHYTVKFQNTGDGPTHYVRVECQLDDKVDLDQISNVEFPDFFQGQFDRTSSLGGHSANRGAIFHVDKSNRKVIFEMHDLELFGTGDPGVTNLEVTRDQVEFDIKVKSNYVFGPATTAVSEVYFDQHDPIVTNEVETICGDPLPESQGGGFQQVTPTPSFWVKWKWYIIGALAAIVGLFAFRIGRKRN